MSPHEKPDRDAFAAIDPRVCIGHVHLKVADLERALAFYCGVLGFDLTQRYDGEAAFVSAGGYHHHIGLNTWASKNGARNSPLGCSTKVGVFIFDSLSVTLMSAITRKNRSAI